MSMVMYSSLLEEYKFPFGSVKRNEKVTFCIKFDIFTDVQNPELVIFKVDDWYNKKTIAMEKLYSDLNSTVYTCSYVPNEIGVYFYYFALTIDNVSMSIRKGEMGLGKFGYPQDECFQLTVYTEKISIPDFMFGGLYYQIFPDRFFKSSSTKKYVPEDRKIHSNWYENPDYLPNIQGEILNDDYFGGDLQGITEKLEYLKSLGVDKIYLNPIFEAHSNHRYNTADYSKIDYLLGTEEDYIELCKKSHELGIRVILDGVFNHTGSDSIYFNRNKRYESIGAYNSKESKYSNWYLFNNFPDSYLSWWNFATLPSLNKFSDDCIDYICDIIEKWIKLGASGFRLDVVDELPEKMLIKISEKIKGMESYGQSCGIIGEVWEDASTKEAYGERKKYLTHNLLDSTMNYPFKNAILSYVRYGNGKMFYSQIIRIIENYPKEILNTLMNSLSTHDTERAITNLVAKEVENHNRKWQAENDNLSENEYMNGKELFKLASIIQYFLPGVPCIYYGDEVGVYGYKDPFSRKTFPWGREDENLLCFFKDLGQIRTNLSFLNTARFVPITITDDICIFQRIEENESVTIAVNRSSNYHKININIQSKVLMLVGSLNENILSPRSAIIF